MKTGNDEIIPHFWWQFLPIPCLKYLPNTISRKLAVKATSGVHFIYPDNKGQYDATKHHFRDGCFACVAFYWLLLFSHNIIVKFLFCCVEPLFVYMNVLIHGIKYSRLLFVMEGELDRYWFSKDCLNQFKPFCTSIISFNRITRAHSDGITTKNVHFSLRRTLCG